MSNAKKCDRCGIFYEPGTGFFGKKHIRKPCAREDYYDLCEFCQEDLDRFMDGGVVVGCCRIKCDDITCPDNRRNKEKEDDGR